MNHRISTDGGDGGGPSNVLCDKKVPLKLEVKFYRAVVRQKMLYETKCWDVKNQENKLSVSEMIEILCWMCRKRR
jgi:hypothetical protein